MLKCENCTFSDQDVLELERLAYNLIRCQSYVEADVVTKALCCIRRHILPEKADNDHNTEGKV